METQTQPDPTATRTHGTEVLIVEDEPTSRRALSRLLSSVGYDTHAFATAEDALGALFQGDHPTAALIDLNLPGMDGLDLIDWLGRLDPSVFPILITATDEQTLAHRLGNRPLTYLRKPVDFERLLSLLTHQPPRS